jgi:hypothetical protein
MAIMSKKARSKGLKKSEELLGGGTVADRYAIGVIGPDPRRTSAFVVMVLAVAIALSFVILGVIIIPGVLLIAAIFGAIDRPASVVVTNRGVAVLARSEFNGRPRKLLAILPQNVLADRTVLRSGAYVHLPDFHIWFRKKEYERLLVGADSELAPNSWAAPVPAGIGARVPGAPNPGPVSPTGTDAALASFPARSSLAEVPVLQPEKVGGVIYCSWCGKERAVNANAIHYCGSMERPAVYCMNCGTSFEEGAASCTACGTPATKLSR